MPQVEVVFYCDEDGTAPVLDWLDTLDNSAIVKCMVRIERLRAMGHELRRPEADYLRDGIYELRIGLQRTNYRILYFFHGRTAAVLAGGLTKQRAVPPRAIDLAARRRWNYQNDPDAHTYRER